MQEVADEGSEDEPAWVGAGPTKWIQNLEGLDRSRSKPAYDLVTASYWLAEFEDDTKRITAMLERMWDHTRPGGLLIIVEPGTPKVRKMRTLTRAHTRLKSAQKGIVT